jgi:hypothetical protein
MSFGFKEGNNWGRGQEVCTIIIGQTVAWVIMISGLALGKLSPLEEVI